MQHHKAQRTCDSNPHIARNGTRRTRHTHGTTNTAVTRRATSQHGQRMEGKRHREAPTRPGMARKSEERGKEKRGKRWGSTAKTLARSEHFGNRKRQTWKTRQAALPDTRKSRDRRSNAETLATQQRKRKEQNEKQRTNACTTLAQNTVPPRGKGTPAPRKAHDMSAHREDTPKGRQKAGRTRHKNKTERNKEKHRTTCRASSTTGTWHQRGKKDGTQAKETQRRGHRQIATTHNTRHSGRAAGKQATRPTPTQRDTRKQRHRKTSRQQAQKGHKEKKVGHARRNRDQENDGRSEAQGQERRHKKQNKTKDTQA
ncbi:hypothetical protein, conserved in T. vivax [Trypanosoma vivax Y486]|uniref:Uncharacterized protein n=1 Tax=Trypanosoma vivax (strain Y486) TaxID=1055687 RepID=F9WTR4_TRYVY|nr:hypothetical protein, conserved in T. vivax [Trypanosoma vivax Y486]|eukprot:CCD20958.1 hypothetical protein, conserved in T. vivax [Trypanosoma vivax Y486]